MKRTLLIDEAYLDSLINKAAKFDAIIESILTKQFIDYQTNMLDTCAEQQARYNKYIDFIDHPTEN